MNPLEARKRLLIAESEINRAQLARDFTALETGVRQYRDQAGTFGSIISSSVKLLTGLAALRHSQPAETEFSWMQTIFKGAALISSLWREFRPRGRRED